MELNHVKPENKDDSEEAKTPLPQWELLNEAWKIGHPEHPGSKQDLADASKLFEKANELTANIDVDTIRDALYPMYGLYIATNSKDIQDTIKIAGDTLQSVMASRWQYAICLSAYGEANGDSSLRQKALDQLYDIGKKDSASFNYLPEIQEAVQQLSHGGWIER